MKILLSLVLSVLLTACAANDTDVDSEHGARRASIVGFYSPSSPRSELPKCLAQLTNAELEASHFAKIRFTYVRMVLNEVAKVPDQLNANVGDQAEIVPGRCDYGHLAQILRIFPQHVEVNSKE